MGTRIGTAREEFADFVQVVSKLRPAIVTLLLFMGFGGLSLLILGVLTARGNYQPSTKIEAIAVLLSVVINSPHFAASLVIMYSDHRAKLLKSFRYVFVGIVLPIALLFLLVWANISSESYGAKVIGTLGAYLVLWHYAKQFYGIIVHFLRKSGVAITRLESLVLKYSLLSIWYYASALLLERHSQNWFVALPRFYLDHVPPAFFTGLVYLTSILFGGGATILLSALIRSSFSGPVLIACVSYISAFVWLLPTFQRPFFIQIIPAFHSLQYLVFVGMKKKSESTHQGVLDMNQLLKFGIAILAGGMLLFRFLPAALSVVLKFNNLKFDPAILIIEVAAVVAIHHYFVDSIIWRRNSGLQESKAE